MKHLQRLVLIILLLLSLGGCGLIPTEREDAASSTTSPLSGVTAIAAGGLHTCALMSDRSVKCWGSNLEGQLGDGTIISKSYPAKVSGINTATQLAASYHTCAILTDNTTQCWGRGDSGQLGDNNSTGSRTPVVVSGLGSAKSIDVLNQYSCAVLTDNTTMCWGNNYYGGSTPSSVAGITTAQALATGPGHTCVLLNEQTIQCWGYNNQGQLGNGTIDICSTNSTGSISCPYNSTPVTVSGISTGTAIVAGGDYSCALLSNNTIKCWGRNGKGQLGDGTTLDRSSPVLVSGISTATSVSAGGNGTEGHSCALLSNNSVKCWGNNDYGQLGDGTTTDRSTSVLVSGISTAIAISAGFRHTCALLSDSTVQCWGYNNQGQLGDRTKVSSFTPVNVLN